jgi:putative hydrolase of the HAD superfamily
MSRSPRAIFFDMDDTLLDGVTAMEAAWPQVLAPIAERHGVDLQHLRDAIRREGSNFWRDEAAVGHWRLDLMGARAIVVGRAFESEGLPAAGAAEVAGQYAALFREHSQLFDDALATLELVRAAGLKTALLTNGPREMQRDKIARFGLAPYFDVIVIEGEFGHGKPEAAVFKHALEFVGARPEEAWHVGDNLYADVGGARSVGVHATWIHRERLKMPGENVPAVPDRTVAHLVEVTAALGLG